MGVANRHGEKVALQKNAKVEFPFLTLHRIRPHVQMTALQNKSHYY